MRLPILVVAMSAQTLPWGIVACSSTSAPTDGGSEARPEAGPNDAAGEAARIRRDAKEEHVDGGAPSLVYLSVTGEGPSDAAQPFRLTPQFSPLVHDYYVRCAPGSNHIEVSMEASMGASSLLLHPASSASSPKLTSTVDVFEDQAIVAAATDPIATVEYWVRCLPHDMPDLAWAPHPDAGALTPGYYLLGSMLSLTGTGGAGFAMVLEEHGVPIWYARSSTSYGVSDVDSVAPGAVSYLLSNGLDVPGQEYEVRQLRPLATTLVVPPSGQWYSHELKLLANGNYLVIGNWARSGVDLTGLSVPLPDGGMEPFGPNSVILDCALLEVTPSGSVVWTWVASDHFDPVKDSPDPILAVGVAAVDGGVAVDPFHLNSLDVDPTSGDLLVSGRSMRSVFYVSRSTGDVLWKMGGSQLVGTAYVSVSDSFNGQHDARLLPGWAPGCVGGAGQVSLYDDESFASGPSRAVIYDVVVGADGGLAACRDAAVPDDATPGRASVAWKYTGPAKAAAQGSFRVQEDGSRVIGWGVLVGGAGSLTFSEVDVTGHDLLDFSFSSGGHSYRAIKVPLGTFDRETLRRTAGLP